MRHRQAAAIMAVVRLACGLLLACMGFVWGAGTGCVVSVDPTMACGDGYVDREAGEECDPQDPAREFESACENTIRPLGTAACDPDTCQIDHTPEQCAICGDGQIDRGHGEECDEIVPQGELCGDGSDRVTCTHDCRLDYDACPTCGNGKVDPPLEECDPYDPAGDITQTLYCSEIPSGYPKPFSYGVILSCLADCEYDRSPCSFCGDGQLDGPTTPRSGAGPRMLGEKCDGDRADPGALLSYCRERCAHSELSPVVLDCNFDCAENCLGFEDVPDEELDCCVPSGGQCPSQEGDFKCCSELEPGNDDPDHMPCVPQWDGSEETWVCR